MSKDEPTNDILNAADDLTGDNEDPKMTRLNSPRMKNVETIQHSYEMYVDSGDLTNDSDDTADNFDEIDTESGFTYREILIITLSSSILIIITIVIAIATLIHKKQRKYQNHPHPDLIPMSGRSSIQDSSYDNSQTPDTSHCSQSQPSDSHYDLSGQFTASSIDGHQIHNEFFNKFR